MSKGNAQYLHTAAYTCSDSALATSIVPSTASPVYTLQTCTEKCLDNGGTYLKWTATGEICACYATCGTASAGTAGTDLYYVTRACYFTDADESQADTDCGAPAVGSAATATALTTPISTFTLYECHYECMESTTCLSFAYNTNT
jgi:hypothetical protein